MSVRWQRASLEVETLRYSLIYDAATAPFVFPLESLFGLIPLALGLALWRFPGLWFDNRERFGRLFGCLVATFGLLILVGVPAIEWAGLRELREALVRHTFTVAEGTVSNFVAGRPDGHPMESFAVDGQSFRYSPFVSPGFNQVSTRGGPIREGLQVRIAVVDGNIARLEVAP